MDTQQKLSPITITLHWVIALAIIAMTGIGFYMSIFEFYPLYDWHKSFGVVIFAVVLVRVWWRIKNGWPVPVRNYPALEQRLARASHWVLIVGTVLMPVSGIVYSAFGGWGIKVFGWAMVAGNKNPATGQTEPIHAGLADLGQLTHEWVGYLILGALILHILGAFKHHLIDKDRTLLRMLGR
ncbi:MAG TPA: cytochrome b [Cellvibrio sp.]|nr:cytochrome b [Cellvibrio sp.]